MKANNIIIVPETHWDREWYLTFQEFRAKLVIMMDKLLDILKNNLDYKNFTFDGQVIPLEDYLEVRPKREEEIKKYVKEGRLSIGPMYILPDEFLVSGESIIRNLILGHQIARRFGRVMKAAYIPDPFGHTAQLPQIIHGFDISSILFARGFGEEFDENNLNVEFIWESPGKAASVLAIHLIRGYGSAAILSKSLEQGIYKKALDKIMRVTSDLEQYTATPVVLLNNGEDHLEAIPEIPEMVKQWNTLNPDILLEQNDFEYYTKKILNLNPNLKSYQGELRGSKYSNILSGVFSARMWIKQRNTKIEYLFEKYSEPLSLITWVLDEYQKFEYPSDYLKTGLKWLIKNHPHDSICGCSIDQVHDEMKTRFDWAEQIGEELIKLSFMYLSSLIKFKPHEKNRIPLIIFNPLPWRRTDIVNFNGISKIKKGQEGFHYKFKLIDSNNVEIEYQGIKTIENPRFMGEQHNSYQFTFLADVPACGFKIYYVILGEGAKESLNKEKDFKITNNSIENVFYKVQLTNDGRISVCDKRSNTYYEDICQFEDVGDWGDEYDFSGPYKKQSGLKFSTKDANSVKISPYLDGSSHKTLKIEMSVMLPVSLTKDRLSRDGNYIENKINLYISLLKGINRIDFKIDFENTSKDHRIRVLFPSKIESEKIYCDGHFHVIPRDIQLPDGKRWMQNPLPTNHQKDFVAVNDETRCFAILNQGLPEYEAIKNLDNTITLAITLLRCTEWLSRSKMASRRFNAGPSLNTPGAQCLGNHSFNLSLIIEIDSLNWLDADIHLKGKEFNCPLKPIFPLMLNSPLRCVDRLMLTGLGMVSALKRPRVTTKEPYLPPEFSFIEINNKDIIMSALKKSEEGNSLIVRVYNVSPVLQRAVLRFYVNILIKKAEIVNLLEESPKNEIKAQIEKVNNNEIEITLEAHVIVTFKIELNLTVNY